MTRSTAARSFEQSVQVEVGPITLEGSLRVPDRAQGVVLFAHGSGSGRHSPRNRYVAEQLDQRGLGTLLIDLLRSEEERVDQYTGHLRFDISFLAERLVGATDWLAQEPRTAGLAIGYFGASTGAGAALVAATKRPDVVGAVVSRGGRPDLARNALPQVNAPTLLMVGGDDQPVIRMNQEAFDLIHTPLKQLVTIPGATHLFSEPGKLEEVARLATDWFSQHLGRSNGQ